MAYSYESGVQMLWQPRLAGPTVHLRPLTEADFEALYLAASDPLVWELHPDRERYTRERFEIYFRSGIESKGALAVVDSATGALIGSSRYTSHNLKSSSVEIGYTFLTRAYWGGRTNRELKTLMLNHAFQHVDTAYFVVGVANLRSRRAMAKIGAVEVLDVSSTPVITEISKNVVYRIRKSDWRPEAH